jgi:hypothetical protein
MRTRIEIDDGQREKLLQLAAERGERGCGRLVQEAVTLYLEHRERPPAPVVLQMEAQPALRAETRTERVRVVIGWLMEEAVGLISVARSMRGRLRRSAVTA